ncbi:Bzip transcription factor [Phytophthora nicotianae]|uniref:Bzip transcription factor n=1 Tax=Phytophthora nicotianae TaxID=4792 RepID=A0A0W8CXI4_PHYNI|nr:Bzip transcription factor [Phytophthora nicotianae]
MKIYVAVAASALAVSSVNAVSDREVRAGSHRTPVIPQSCSCCVYLDQFCQVAEEDPNSDKYHTKPVRVIQARVQSDAPIWNETTNAFGSKYYDTAEEQFRGALDTVNTASVEGALMYVQAEGINYNTRSEEDRCWRKNGMQYVVFYDIVFAQTNETVAEYESEYGPMLPMDGGQCTPISGTNVFSKECVSLNGNTSVPNLGPFIGGESKETDARAPYPNCWWYSFPNNCPLQKWANKTEECRDSTRQGLCDMDTLPDGISCTYNYRILGYVPIDDAVGITAMTNKATGEKYANFTEFCEAGGVEFQASEAGVWNASIPFWKDPQNATANAVRTQKLLSAYANLLKSNKSSQIESAVIRHMQPLPTVAELTAGNPPCYFNVKDCDSEFGCKRELYGQMCTLCNSTATGCVRLLRTLPSDSGEGGGDGRCDDGLDCVQLRSGGWCGGGIGCAFSLASLKPKWMHVHHWLND